MIQPFIKKLQQSINFLLSKVNGLSSDVSNLKETVNNLPTNDKSIEPYVRDVALYPLQVTRGFGAKSLGTRMGNLSLGSTNYAQPFWVQQKVNLTRYMISPFAIGPNIGKFVIYKFDSEVNPLIPSTDLNFSLVYEETPQSLSGPGVNMDFISTPVTLVPGEVYIAMFVPDTSFPVEAVLQQPTSVWDTNKFLGTNGNFSMNGRMTGLTASIQLGASPTYTAPSTIVANCSLGNVTTYEYLKIGLKNA